MMWLVGPAAMKRFDQLGVEISSPYYDLTSIFNKPLYSNNSLVSNGALLDCEMGLNQISKHVLSKVSKNSAKLRKVLI
jgi:hypothetical protein